MILSTVLLMYAAKLNFINEYARQLEIKHGIEKELILAIIKVESNFNPNAIGKTHKERGLMQLRPTFHKASFDIKENMDEGVTYLAKMRKVCNNRYKEAWFVCYNTGSNVKLEFVQASNYYQKVKVAYGEQKRKSSIYRMCSSQSSSKLCNQAIP